MAASALSATVGNAASSVTVVSAETADNGDGFIDRVVLTFNTPLKTTTQPQISDGTSPGFYVDGYDIGSITFGAGPVVTTLNLNLVKGTEYDTAATPGVHYVGPGGGLEEAAAGLELDAYNDIAEDGTGAVLVAMTANDFGTAGVFNAASETTTLSFSEPVTLAGATPLDRWSHLEAAIKFNNIVSEGSGCPADGAGDHRNNNFPQPSGTSADPIDQPLNATSYVETFVVKHKANNAYSNPAVPAVPRGCWVGIDTATGAASYVLDAAGNAAHTQVLDGTTPVQNHQTYINPVDSVLTAARTLDGRDGAPNGLLDAIELTFDQNIDDSTIGGLANVTVELDGAPAVIDLEAVDTGAIANDKVVNVRFTPASASWNGAERPHVSYAKPDTCTATAGTGLKAIVPTGGSYRACVASFDTVATDGAGPVLSAVETIDGNSNGKLDHVRATFSEPIVATNKVGWKIDGVTATSADIVTSDARNLDLGFAEASLPNTDALPSVVYTAQAVLGNRTTDGAAAEVPAVTKAATDGAAPRIISTTVFDSNEDGALDRAVLVYSEAIVDPADAAASAFELGGHAATGFAAADADDTDPDVADDNITSLQFSGISGSDSKGLTFAPGTTAIEDVASNGAPSQSVSAANVVDKAKPVGTVTITPGAPLKAGTSTISVTFTEAMENLAPTVTFGTKTVTPATTGHTNGWDDANPNIWNGSVLIEDTDCLEPTGCAITASLTGAQDLASNDQLNAASLATEIDTIAPVAPTPGGFSATEVAGETVPANTLNMFTTGFGVSAPVTPAHAEGGSAEILVDGSPLTPAATDATIGEGDTSVTPSTDFATRSALQSAIADGAPHAITLRLCDDANNCTASATALDITADYTPVAIDLGAPAGDDVVAGGSSLDIIWDGDETAAGFDHVELAYSTNDGSTFPNAISSQTTPDGSIAWSVPTIDVADAKVRVTTVDANGNKASDASGSSFVIDSSAPALTITAPVSSNPFIPAGGDTVVKWSAVDASISRAADPIVIEYSTNAGSTWKAINAGSYSKANDGQEVWHVPSGAGLTTLVRVKATDATNKSTTKVSTKLAKGVAGFTVERGGKVYGFGTASNSTAESKTSSSDFVRGIAVRGDDKTGYVLSSTGRLYPFAAGGATKPSRPATITSSADLARGVVLRTDSSGYVVRANGKLYKFGSAPTPHVSKTWTGDNARGVVMLSSGRGGYVLDKFGKLYPFSVGSYSKPKSLQSTTISSTGKAVSVVLRSNQTSGWVLTGDGKLHAFGGAPAKSSTGTSSTAGARSLIRVTDDGGYWLDGKGVLRAWGSAFGNPTKQVFSSGYARGAAS